MLTTIQEYIKPLNSSMYFSGLMMLFLNIGSKYVNLKLSPTQEMILNSEIAKQILVFTIAWIGTRDIITSLILTAVFYVLVLHLFNEDSKFCILPKRIQRVLDLNNDGEVSEEEINKAVEILNKANKKTEKEQYLQLMNSFQSI